MEREKAAIGVLLTLEGPTKAMRTEAASAGFYKSNWSRDPHTRLQIIAVGELLDGRKIDMLPVRQTSVTYYTRSYFCACLRQAARTVIASLALPGRCSRAMDPFPESTRLPRSGFGRIRLPSHARPAVRA